MIRRDEPDVVYRSEEAKFNAVIREIEEMHRIGRPVLVGTVSIEASNASARCSPQGNTSRGAQRQTAWARAGIVARAGQYGV
ncbi:MAG: hypothetical protein R2839_10785 [Thermomicrobiales bacterium]